MVIKDSRSPRKIKKYVRCGGGGGEGGWRGVLKKRTNCLIFHTTNRILSDKLLDSC